MSRYPKEHTGGGQLSERVILTENSSHATALRGRSKQQQEDSNIIPSMSALSSTRGVHYTISRDGTNVRQRENQMIVRALKRRIHKEHNRKVRGSRIGTGRLVERSAANLSAAQSAVPESRESVNGQTPAVQQPTRQKRAQPPASANDDVMEIPNPNAQQQSQTNNPRPTGPLADTKLPNLTKEQLNQLNPVQREQLKKRYESLRQANAGAQPMQGGAPTAPQAPMAPQQNDNKSQTIPDIDATFKRLYQDVNHPKGPHVQQDPQAVEQVTGILRKIYKTYSQIDKILSTALRLPEFTEDRIKQLMRAKITVYHNWDASTDSVKGYLSINLNSAIYAQRLVGEFLRDMNQAKARGQLNQQLAQQAQQQGQAQQPALGNPNMTPRQGNQAMPPPPAPKNGVQQPPSDMGGLFGGSENLVNEGSGLNMDFADVSAGGGDVLGNFDFDSFLNTNDGGMGFDFPNLDGGLEARGDGMRGQ